MSDSRPNILLLVADDMNWDAVGVYGCPTPGTTPNIDRLAGEGIRFDHAHVNIAVCQPSRSVLMTGRYPHRCGGEGFYRLRDHSVPILPAVLREAGYAVAALGKLAHSTPHEDFAWDVSADMYDLGYGRNPAIYREYAEGFLARAREQGKPFFLMLNAHDPHRPFYGNDGDGWYQPGGEHRPAARPSRTFTPEEVKTPGFLPDLPDIRREIAYYYNSVRRCDDVVGVALEMLQANGLERDTIVVFLSDNGMAFPFSKSNCYLHSTKAPWILRWPARMAAGRVEREHFVSGVDLMPTLLDAAGVALPAGMDGRSFLPLCEGGRQPGRDYVFTQFYQSQGKRNFPMRCVQDRRYGYIFNPWANGERRYVYEGESKHCLTIAAMRRAAVDKPAVARRLKFMRLRALEELYDFRADPNALRNLASDPAHAAVMERFRAQLAGWMAATGDPALSAFEGRSHAEAREDYLARLQGIIGGES